MIHAGFSESGFAEFLFHSAAGRPGAPYVQCYSGPTELAITGGDLVFGRSLVPMEGAAIQSIELADARFLLSSG